MVDETEKGWFVQYIDRDPETLRKMEAAKNREKQEKDDEERLAAFIQVTTVFALLPVAFILSMVLYSSNSNTETLPYYYASLRTRS